VAVKSKLRNDNSSSSSMVIGSTIYDSKGNSVAKTTSTKSVSTKTTSTLTQTLKVSNPHLWNGLKDPYMYTVQVTVTVNGAIVDTVTQPLGLRTFKVDPAKGFFLNGKPYDLHGVAMHQDREDHASVPERVDVRHAALREAAVALGVELLDADRRAEHANGRTDGDRGEVGGDHEEPWAVSRSREPCPEETARRIGSIQFRRTAYRLRIRAFFP